MVPVCWFEIEKVCFGGIGMKSKIQQMISLTVTIIFLVFLCVMLSSCSKTVVLENFSASETNFLIGQETTITFTVESENVKSINLCTGDGKKVGKMQDMGVDGDVTPNDGIYTCVIKTTVNELISVQYFAKYLDITSEKISVSYFNQPSEELRQEYIDVQQQVDAIEAQYLEEDGYVSDENIPEVLKQVAEYAKELKEEGTVLSYEITESSIVMKLSSGLTTVYAPEQEGTYSISSDTQMSVRVYQPYFEWVSIITDNYISLPNGIDREVDLLTSAAGDIEEVFENYTFSEDTTYIDEEVNLETIKEFGANQIILWQGHGVYAGEDIHSLICTGTEFDWDAWLWDPEYFMDCCRDRIVEYNGNETISSKFIDEYCNNLDNSFVYLGPCESGYDDILANSFLNKGADAVVANTKTILCLYGDMMEYTTTHLMTQINSETQNYYTLKEALEEAKSLYGESDAQYDGEGAVPTIFGGENAENYRLGDYTPTYVQDFTIPDTKIITSGEISVIEPELYPKDADSYTFTWTSSDETVASVTPEGNVGIIHAKSKGTTTITVALVSGENTITKTTSLRVASKGRDTVLVLDISGSMSGTPLTEMKEAAIDFCYELLEDEYNNRVGIVFYDDENTTIPLTDDLSSLVSYIEQVNDGGMTNMEGAIASAKNMLVQQGKADSIKNIVIMADGLPNDGKTSNSGAMNTTSTTSTRQIAYASAVIDTAQEAMKSYNMYSLGFFHDLSDSNLDFAIELMKKLTNQEDGYHQVEEAENLQFAFEDISEEISDGSKIVINIACPVDVVVSYNGETLCSAVESYSSKTSFGTLQLLGSNEDIKVLSLEPDNDYEVQLVGTGDGMMNYSVNYMNEDDDITDSREFRAVPITPTTKITSKTNVETEDMALNIDEDGDGKVDTIWSATKNAIGSITYKKNPEPEETQEVVETEPVKENETESDKASYEMEVWQLALIIIGVLSFAAIAVVTVVVCMPITNKTEDEEKQDDLFEEERTTEDKEPEYVPAISIIDGPLAGAEIPIRGKEILYIGKDSQRANIVFTSDYIKVSRLHCSITYDAKHQKYFVTDSSSNGTYYMNHIKLEKGKRTAVSPGTTIILGDDSAKITLR